MFLCDINNIIIFYLPTDAVVKFLGGSETDDGINNDGRVNRGETVNKRDDHSILLTIITANISTYSYIYNQLHNHT